jgi:uncharacterized membrane protein YccC
VQRREVIVHWFTGLADRFFASDHGLVRLRFAGRAVLTVALSALILALLHAPAINVLFGAAAGMVCSTSMRTGTTGQRGLNIVLFAPVMAASITSATLLAPHRIFNDLVFIAVMFIAVYLRRFDQLGFSLGMGAFMAYFFASYFHAAPSMLPWVYLSVLIGLASCAIMALLVFRDTPESLLRRTTLSIRAQLARLIDELIELLDRDEPLPDAEEVPRSVARQATRTHETILQIEDNADLLGLDPQWQRQLVDAELSADRLARATARAMADNLNSKTKRELAEDLRGLHRFVDRDPTAALTLDTDELLRRIGRYDIRGDPGLAASKPEHHALLVQRAIRELLLSIVELRRTTAHVLSDPDAAFRRYSRNGGQGTSADGADSSEATERATAGNNGAVRELNSDIGEPAERSDQAGNSAPATESSDRAPDGSGKLARLAPSTRSAVQAAIGGGLAILGGELLSDQRWYWAVITGFIVFGGTTTRGDLLVKGWRRVWGTLLGIIAGVVLATVLAGNLVLNVTVLLACIFLAFYSLRVSYATMTFFITIMLGMLYDVLGTFRPGLLLLRLEETAIGVSAAAIAAMLVLPTRTRITVLAELHDYFAALNRHLRDAERLLVHADRVSVIASTREVDRAATDVSTAIAPMLHRLSPSRVRRGQAIRLLTLTEESALAARNLARAAEPGALAGLPDASRTLDRLISNTEALLAATEDPPKSAHLVSGPELAPTVDARALVAAHSCGAEPDRIEVLHLRRTINWLDRLDKLLLGMAAPLEQTVRVPTGVALDV